MRPSSMSAKLLLGLIGCGICAAPAAGRIVTFGSSLKADATVAEAHRVDTAFWPTALAGGRRFRAPATGQVLEIRLKGIAIRNPMGPPPITTIFFQHLRPRPGGRMKVLQTSAAFLVPFSGDPNTITTYRPENLCARRGD